MSSAEVPVLDFFAVPDHGHAGNGELNRTVLISMILELSDEKKTRFLDLLLPQLDANNPMCFMGEGLFRYLAQILSELPDSTEPGKTQAQILTADVITQLSIALKKVILEKRDLESQEPRFML